MDIQDVKRLNLIRFRNDLRLTQRELADKINVAESYVSMLETGIRGIGNHTLKKLARALNRVESEFFKTEDKREPPQNQVTDKIWEMLHDPDFEAFEDMWVTYKNCKLGIEEGLVCSTINALVREMKARHATQQTNRKTKKHR